MGAYVISARFIHNSSNRIRDIFQFLFLDIRLFLGCHITNLQENFNLVGKYSRVRPVHVKFFQGCEKSLARHEYSDKRVYLYTFLARYLLVNYREKARSVLKYRVVSSSIFSSFFRSRGKIVIRYFLLREMF